MADIHTSLFKKLFFQFLGWTGLILASRRGNLRIVMELLDKGADMHKATKVCTDA